MPALVLTAIEVIRATPRTRIIRLALDHTPFSFVAGQAVMVGLHDGAVRKPYSLASAPWQTADAHAVELLVQVEPADELDPHLERVLPGTLVDIEGPFGDFALPEPLLTRDLLFAAGGTGIAPLRSMLWEALRRDLAERIVVLYSARNPDEFAYQRELEELARARRIELHLTITRTDETTWEGRRGRVDDRLIAHVLRSAQTQSLVCGPPAFVDHTIALLKQAGVPDALVACERHG